MLVLRRCATRTGALGGAVALTCVLGSLPAGCSAREPVTAETAAEPEPAVDQPRAEAQAEAQARTEAQVQVAGSAGPIITMRVGADHRELFVPLERARYEVGELAGLFTRMEEGADVYCDYLWHRGHRDRPDVSGFVHDPEGMLEAGVKTKKTIVAGCYNFVTMNDQLPDRDFQLIRMLYPDEEFDCYSVGVMQPYLMQKHLGCRTLTMLDLDWEVHNMHWGFLQRFREGSMVAERLDETLSQMRATWVAFREPALRHDMGLHMLCGKRQRDRCREALVDFQRHFLADADGRGDAPEQITLTLSSLHDADYSVEGEGPPRTKVIFLSNAIEDLYTTKYQFVGYMKNMKRTLAPGQKAIFIHHVGGRTSFGVYELERTEDDAVVRTVCRDPYENTSGYHEGSHYETWFDGVTKTVGRVPYCRPWRARLAREQGLEG